MQEYVMRSLQLPAQTLRNSTQAETSNRFPSCMRHFLKIILLFFFSSIHIKIIFIAQRKFSVLKKKLTREDIIARLPYF
jgi:hypothetical protein